MGNCRRILIIKIGESFDSPFILLYYIYMGYVYLIQDIDNDTYKIGVTKGDPQTRLKKLQTGNSCKLEIKYLYECKYPYRLETMLHNYYKEYQVINEWFGLPDINGFLDKCHEFDNIISILKDNPFFSKNLR